MSGGNYVRVYTSILSDEKFHGMSLETLGAWLRLLLYADEMYPAPAPLPRWLKDRNLDDLERRGLVDRCGDEHYEMHGLRAERERRAAPARKSAISRWEKERTQSERNANAMRTHSEGNASRAEPSKAKPSQADARDADVVLAYNIATLRNPTGWVLDRLNELARAFGEEEAAQAVGRACQEHAGDKPSVQLNAAETLLLAAQRQRQKDAEARARSRAIEEQEAARKRIENASPEELAKVEENKRRVAEMLAAAGKEMA